MSKPDHLRVIEGGEEPPPTDPLVGQTIDGRYVIERVIGEGGMGIVYAARHTVLNKPLAVKVLRAEVSRNGEIIARFRQEAQSASAIGSEHIIDISDFGTLKDGSTYFVMELLEGRPLGEVLEQEKPMDVARSVHVAKQLCRALGDAHERGIVHRDLKPDNIFLIDKGGDPAFVKVLDFGIAKVGDGPSHLTKAGQVFGTPHYMSPEQCAGSGVDHRTDIYALGVILYEMTAARVPFDADNLMGILTKHMYEEPPPPHTLPPPVSVPSNLEAVILRCLAKSPDARYQTMGELYGDLHKIEQGATPDAVLERVDRASGAKPRAAQTRGSAIGIEVGGEDPQLPGRSRGLVFAVGGLVALLAAGGAAWAFAGGGEPEPETAATAGAGAVEPAGTGDTPDLEPADDTPVGVDTAALVEVTSEPDGVEVWSGDELLGNTPLSVARPAGRDRLRLQLRAAGFENRDVSISELTAASVNVQLERSDAAGRQRARPSSGRPRPNGDDAVEPRARPSSQGGVSPTSEIRDPWAD